MTDDEIRSALSATYIGSDFSKVRIYDGRVSIYDVLRVLGVNHPSKCYIDWTRRCDNWKYVTGLLQHINDIRCDYTHKPVRCTSLAHLHTILESILLKTRYQSVMDPYRQNAFTCHDAVVGSNKEHIETLSEQAKQTFPEPIVKALHDKPMVPLLDHFGQMIDLSKEWNEPQIVAWIVNALGPDTTETEFQLDIGRVDIVTPSIIIEVKRADKWMHGVGQLYIYGGQMPEKRRVLVLFDECSTDTDIIFRECAKHHIRMVYVDIETASIDDGLYAAMVEDMITSQ